MKHVRRPDMRTEGLKRVVRLLTELEIVDIMLILRYILTQRHDIVREDIERVLIDYAPERGDEIMETWLDESFNRGKAEGKAEGLAEGLAKTLRKLLTRRFGAVSEDMERRIGNADAETLDLWIQRAIDAESPADVTTH
jgi:hypothetical protein